MLKGHGVFCNIGSNKHKAKLRVLYEVGPIAYLIEKAGGKTLSDEKVSLMEFEIKGYDDRIGFAMGSSEEVDSLAHAFNWWYKKSTKLIYVQIYFFVKIL